MDSRRSVRSRKTVDYAKFSCGDSEDDDFRSSSSPPSKKRKQERAVTSKPQEPDKKEGKRSLRLTDSKRTSSQSTGAKDNAKVDTFVEEAPSSSGRLPVAEKVYQRELKTALELSKKAMEKENVEIRENVNKKGEHLEEEEDHPDSEDASDCVSSDPEQSSTESDNLSDWSEESSPQKAKKTKTEKKPANGKTANKEKTPSSVKTSLRTKAEDCENTRLVMEDTNKLQQAKQRTRASRDSLDKHIVSSTQEMHILVKPANLPTMGLKLGLSRKTSVKPLHPTLKVKP